MSATQTPDRITIEVPPDLAEEFLRASRREVKGDGEAFGTLDGEHPDDQRGNLRALKASTDILGQLLDGETVIESDRGTLRYLLDEVGRILAERIVEHYETGPAPAAAILADVERLRWVAEQAQGTPEVTR